METKRITLQEKVLLVGVLVSLLATFCIQPAWRKEDPRMQVWEAAIVSEAELGVYLDPWGSPLVQPRFEPVPSGYLTRPRLTHEANLAKLRELMESAGRNDQPALQVAAQIAKLNAGLAEPQLSFPPSAIPYRFVGSAGAPAMWLESYSMGPNKLDELGHGDDVQHSGTGLIRLYRKYSWLWPLTITLWLLAIGIVCRVVPTGRSLRGELPRSLGISCTALALAWLNRSEFLPGSYERDYLARLLDFDAPAGVLAFEPTLFLSLGVSTCLLCLFLRLPRLQAPPRRAEAVGELPPQDPGAVAS